MFVEDVVREVALNIGAIKEVPWFRVEAGNRESVYNHSAYAFLEKGLRPGEKGGCGKDA